jgi:hypothetical protein
MRGCLGSLSKLMAHFAEPMIVTGGVAAGWHLLKNGAQRKMHRLNDIDIVVEDLSSLPASVSRDFLIRHFHPFREKGKILLMLVDEEHGTRIDVFTPSTNSLIQRLTGVTFGEIPLRLISAEDLLAKLLSIVYAVTESKPVEAKYVEHFNSLSMVADLKTVREIWREYRKENQLLDFDEAAELVQRSVTSAPALLQANHYSQDINQTCAWCQESNLFPLAPLPKIYEILGYV